MSVSTVSSSLNNKPAENSNFYVRAWNKHPTLMSIACAAIGAGVAVAYHNKEAIKGGFQSGLNVAQNLDRQKLLDAGKVGYEFTKNVAIKSKNSVAPFVAKIGAEISLGVSKAAQKTNAFLQRTELARDAQKTNAFLKNAQNNIAPVAKGFAAAAVKTGSIAIQYGRDAFNSARINAAPVAQKFCQEVLKDTPNILKPVHIAGGLKAVHSAFIGAFPKISLNESSDDLKKLSSNMPRF